MQHETMLVGPTGLSNYQTTVPPEYSGR